MMPTRWYTSANRDFTLVQGDCVETLRGFDFEFDMAFADPPYFLSNGGISVQAGKCVCVDKGNWDKPRGREEEAAFTRAWLGAVRDKLAPHGTVWVSGTFHNIFAVAEALEDLGFRLLNAVVWEKSNPPPNLSCRYFTHSAEIVLWARKSEKVPHRYNYEAMRAIAGGKQMRDVWKLPAIAPWEKVGGVKHPTQKPLSLLARIILACTRPGDWVLDPFCGSGTTGVAAALFGRRFLGIDLEADFLRLARNRREALDEPGVRQETFRKLQGFEQASALAESFAANDGFCLAESDLDLPF